MLLPLRQKTIWAFNFCFFSFWLGHHPELAEVPESALGRWPRRGVVRPSFALVCPYVEHCEIMGRWRRLQGPPKHYSLNRHMTEPYSRLSLSPAFWDCWCLWCWWGWWRRVLLWFWFWLWLQAVLFCFCSLQWYNDKSHSAAPSPQFDFLCNLFGKSTGCDSDLTYWSNHCSVLRAVSKQARHCSWKHPWRSVRPLAWYVDFARCTGELQDVWSCHSKGPISKPL